MQRLLVGAWVLGIAACTRAPVPGEGSAPPIERPASPWSETNAIAYLQRRSTLWLDRRPCALSCHTTHPFLLADRGSPVKDRILAKVTSRVRAWPDVDWWYTSDAAKVAESRGTEAVLNAFALAGSPDAPRALDAMFREQRADGGWSWLDFGLAPWELGAAEVTGAALALIAVTRSSYQPPPERRAALDQFIAARKRAGIALHDKLALVWAAQSTPNVLTAEETAAYVAEAVRMRRTDGGFRLSDFGTWLRTDGTANNAEDSDAYATAFVAFVLAGSRDPAAQAAVAAARCWLLSRQQPSGAWLGRSMNDDDAFNRDLMSDAATAFATIVLRDGSPQRCGSTL